MLAREAVNFFLSHGTAFAIGLVRGALRDAVNAALPVSGESVKIADVRVGELYITATSRTIQPQPSQITESDGRERLTIDGC
jgi:hypothetical protein